MRIPTCLIVLAALPSGLPEAAIYRCELDGGHISYQQVPCSGTSKPLVLRERSRGWTALRPGEKALLEQYRREEHGPVRGASPSRPAPGAAADCRRARGRLAEIRGKLRRGYKVADSNRLHAEHDRHQAYLGRSCGGGRGQ